MGLFTKQVQRHHQARAQGAAPVGYPIFDPKSGLRLDKDPWMTPEQAFTVLEDFYVRNGKINKRAGFRLLGELGTYATETITDPNTTNWIHMLTLFPIILDGGSYEITLTDGTSTWKWNGLPPIEVLDNRIILDRTLPTPNAAQGSLDLDTGRLFMLPDPASDVVVTYEYTRGLPTMGITSFIDTDKNEHLIACDTRRLFEYDVGDERWVDKCTGGDIWSGDDSDFMVFAPFDDYLYITNGPDPPQRYNAGATPPTFVTDAGTDFDTVHAGDDMTTAQTVLAHRRRLMYFDITEVTGGTPTTTKRPWRVRLSNVNAPEIMSPGDASDATAAQKFIGAKVQSEDDILVFFESSHQVLHYTGDDFRFPYIWKDGSPIHGAVGKMGIEVFDGAAFVRALSAITSVNGRAAQRVDLEIPDITQSWNPAAAKYTYAFPIPELRQVIMSYADKGSDYPGHLLVLDSEQGYASTYSNMEFHCFGRYTQQAAPSLDSMTDVLDTYTDPVDSWGGEKSAQPVVLAGSRDSKIYYLFSGATDAGAPIKGRARTVRLSPDPRFQFLLNRVRVHATAVTDGTLTIKVYKDFEDAPFMTKTVSLTPTGTQGKVYRHITVGQTGRFFQIEVESNDANAVSVDLIEPWMTRIGEVRSA